MSAYELAQLNIAVMKEPLESPRMADFVANLDRINALAESSHGFVWRLQTEEGDATALRPLGEDTLVNVSVWRDVESLNTYVYGSAHVRICAGATSRLTGCEKRMSFYGGSQGDIAQTYPKRSPNWRFSAAKDRPKMPSRSAVPFWPPMRRNRLTIEF